MHVTRISRYIWFSVLSAVSVTAVGLGTYYPWIRGSTCTLYSTTLNYQRLSLRLRWALCTENNNYILIINLMH